MAVTTTKTGTLAVNETHLYYEIRGTGPALLLVSGATGDAGHFQQVAELLAAEYTVITYDRRGNSRSEPAQGATSLDQQADDASALLRELHLAPADVFGTSGGAVIALRLAMRTPGVVARLLIHEPPLIAALPDGDQLLAGFRAQTEQALASVGIRATTEMFIRENAGADGFDRLDPDLRERMLGNGPRLFQHELAMFVSWVPSHDELATLRMPVDVLAGNDSRAMPPHRGAAWLAQALGAELVVIPGAHAPYLTQPAEFAAALRPILSRR